MLIWNIIYHIQLKKLKNAKKFFWSVDGVGAPVCWSKYTTILWAKSIYRTLYHIIIILSSNILAQNLLFPFFRVTDWKYKIKFDWHNFMTWKKECLVNSTLLWAARYCFSGLDWCISVTQFLKCTRLRGITNQFPYVYTIAKCQFTFLDNC